MRTAFKLISALGILSILIAGVTVSLGSLPPLGDLLNPYDGIYETARLSSHPQKREINSEFVSSKVRVLRNNFGVPHIFAESDKDMAFSLGYVHAQDRLWQMDMLRRSAEGKMAEILGKNYIDDDNLMLRIGLKRSAERAVKELEGTNLMDLLKAYTKGVNKRIKEGNLPLEFKLLNYEPSLWKPKDTLAVAKYMAWGLSGTLEPLKHQEVAEKFGREATWNELFPEETPYFTPIHDPPYDYAKNAENGKNTENIGNGSEEIQSQISFSKDRYSSWALNSHYSLGSNNWVVDDENSETGAPILSSDPHLQLPMPSVWYQTYLNSEEGYHTAGATFPGIPAILIGTNRNIAWGLTNISADDTDFYTYQTNPQGTEYLHDGEWLNFEEENVKIEVKGSEDIQMTIRKTIHGPIVETGDKPIAIKWTGHDTWGEIRAIYKINKAENLSQFKEGLKYWHCPPQNFAYADRHGNIAMFSAGKYPIHENELSGVGLQDGSNPKYNWENYIPFEEIPYTINPPKGYISSANQDPVTENYPYYLGRFFAPGYRGRRIDNLLASKKSHSIEDFKKYQSDMLSVSAKEIVPYLLEAAEEKSLKTLSNQGIEILKDWNYEMGKEKTAPAIWTVWETLFFRNTFEDEYRNRNALGLPFPRTIVLEKLVKEKPNSVWFDDVSTPDRENMENIMIKSLDEAIKLLENELGGEINEWKWGDINKVYFEHLTGIDALSRGPYSSSGGRSTPKVSPPAETHPDLKEMVQNGEMRFTAKHGQSWRMIVSPGEKYIGIYPGGQSSNPLSKHYDDMLKKYLDFEYNTITLPSEAEDMKEGNIESRLFILTED